MKKQIVLTGILKDNENDNLYLGALGFSGSHVFSIRGNYYE